MTDMRHPYARAMLAGEIESLEDDVRQLGLAIEVAEEHTRSLRERRLSSTCALIRARRDLARLTGELAEPRRAS